MNSNRTKIVSTLGPASSNEATLLKMIQAGVNVFRINFSHGNHEQHLSLIRTVRKINRELNSHVAILGDLQGPKLRIGDVPEEGIPLSAGQELIFTQEKMIGTSQKVFIKYKSFPIDVKKGEVILVDDGKLQFEILESDGVKEVKAKALNEGVLYSKKGVNLPQTKVTLPALTKKDRKDLDFALEHHFDWIGLSFVRSHRDIMELKTIISDQQKHTRIIAKIEKPEAIDNLQQIIQHTDGVMIARGDLGVEIPMQDVPLIQKLIIKQCRQLGKPTIVATQMMESMISQPTPTRAEVNDVANAVLDNADAVMLSGETSIGKYPVEVVKAMSKIIQSVEKHESVQNAIPNDHYQNERFITDNICFSAAQLGQRVKAEAILMMTHSGYTAYRVSSMRPTARIFAFTSNRKLLSQMSLVWGVTCIYYNRAESTDGTIADIKTILRDTGRLKTGDLIINITSMPIAAQGMTNMLKLGRV